MTKVITPPNKTKEDIQHAEWKLILEKFKIKSMICQLEKSFQESVASLKLKMMAINRKQQNLAMEKRNIHDISKDHTRKEKLTNRPKL